MAGRPPDHVKWKPGQSGNPSGRPKGIIRSDEVQALLGRLWKLTREELQKIVQDPKSTMGEIMVASVMARAAKDGDASRLQFLLDRAVGKVRESLEVSMVKPYIAATLEGDIIELGVKTIGPDDTSDGA